MPTIGEDLPYKASCVLYSSCLFFRVFVTLVPFLAYLMNGEKTLWVVNLWKLEKRVMKEGARGGKGFFKW